jgi:beta-galactosidase
MAWHVDWTAYKEYQIRWSVMRIARMLREHGICDVPIFHDVAFRFHTPLDIARLEEAPEIDWVGMNLYRNKEGYRGAIQRVRYLAGTTRLPFIPELGCGIWSHHALTSTPDEQEFITLLTLMYGLKAFNLYMLVERERWQGSPITRHGTFRSEYAAFYQRMLSFARRYQLWSLRRDPRALLLLNYDLGRYAALASTLHFAHADLYGLPGDLFTVDLPLDFQWDVAREADHGRYDNWLGTAIRSFESRSLDYDLSDTHSSLSRLCRYPLVFVPTVDFMDADDQARLLAYVEQGGQLVIGPGLPSLDPALRSCEVLKAYIVAPGRTAYGEGSIWWIGQDEVSTVVEQLVSPGEYLCDNAQLLLVQQKNARHILLFLANPMAQTQEAVIHFSGPRRFTDIWSELPSRWGRETITLELEPYTVQIWEVHHD